jgi:hypothetical protein
MAPRRLKLLPIVPFALLATLSACETSDPVDETLIETVTLQGSVGDGPVAGATVEARTKDGLLLGLTQSSSTADYELSFSSVLPVPIELIAHGGTDLVTGGELDMELASVVTEARDQTANINVFTTMVTHAADAMPTGISRTRLQVATEYMYQSLSFGLDRNVMASPFSTPVTAANVAAVVRANEALAETLRRTQASLAAAGQIRSMNEITMTLARDLADGFIDGMGYGANPQIAATFNVLSGQVLVELVTNKLRVGGSEATSAMDQAIAMIVPEATATTAQVAITKSLLNEARIALSAGQLYLNDSSLEPLITSLDTIAVGSSSSAANGVVPANWAATLEPLQGIASAPQEKFAAINAKVKQEKMKPGEPDDEEPPVQEPDPDVTAPVISLIGDNPLRIEVNGQLNDPGATAVDNVDGDISHLIMADTDNVDLAKPGTYTIIYRVTDAAGNVAEVQRTVEVYKDTATVKGDYYVAKNGSDSNPGTIDRPFATVGKAASVVQPGDVVLIREGVYPIKQTFQRSGTKSAPITYQAFPGEKVVFDGSNRRAGVDKDRLEVYADWNIFRGFEIAHSPERGIWINNANDNLFEDLLIHHSTHTGAQVVNGNRNQFIRIVSHSNYDPQYGGENADGISLYTGSGNVVRHCVFYNNSDDGFDTWRSTDAVIEYNIVYGNGYGSDGDGNGFKLGGGGGTGGHRVVGNIAFNNLRSGFHNNGADIPITVFNNTAWDNGLRLSTTYKGNYHFLDAKHVLRNNLAFGGGDLRLGNSIQSHNSWNLGISSPKLVSVDVDSPDFVKPAAGSPLIDAGTNVGLPYVGSAPDVGAVEYGN